MPHSMHVDVVVSAPRRRDLPDLSDLNTISSNLPNLFRSPPISTDLRISQVSAPRRHALAFNRTVTAALRGKLPKSGWLLTWS